MLYGWAQDCTVSLLNQLRPVAGAFCPLRTSYDINRIIIKVDYIFICAQSSIKFFNPFVEITKVQLVSMLQENHQQLHQSFPELFIYQDNILIKRIFRNNSVTRFFSFILIRNRIRYRKASINCFNTYFFSHKAFMKNFYWRRISIDNFITHFWVL